MATPASEADCTLQVAGVAPSVTEAALLNMFRIYGPILRTASTSYGSAHIVFQHSASAQRAVKATNGAMLEGKRITVSIARSFKKTSRPCRSFQVGLCRQGDSCKYLHVGSSGDALLSKPAVAKAVRVPVVVAATAVAKTRDTIRNVPAKNICEFFRRVGQCKNGDACRYVHLLDTDIAKAYSDGKGDPAPPATTPMFKKTLCQFFALGKCERGDACTYSHGEPAPAATSRAKATATVKSVKSVNSVKSVKPVALVKKPVTLDATKTTSATDASRTCVECEQAGVAQWECSKCDRAHYCDACFALVHQSKVMRSHTRTQLAPLVVRVANPQCDECEATESSVQCAQCAVVLCASCDASVHQFKSLRTHVRSTLRSEAEATTATTLAAPVAMKRRPVAAVAEPALKKQKATAQATTTASSVGAMAYVESVPKFDLSSDSEASDSDVSVAYDMESENESDIATGGTAAVVPVAPVTVSTTKAAGTQAVPEIAYVESVPKYELSSDESESESDGDDKEEPQQAAPMEIDDDSDSDSDDNDDKPPVVAAPTVTPTKVVRAAVQTVAAPTRRRGDISSESSDDEDERPIVHPSSVRPVAAPKPVETASSHSSSSESSDDEDEKPRVAAAVAPRKPVVAADSDSDSDSSDDDAVATSAPVNKSTVVKPATATVAKRAPVKAHRGSATPGISTGSSHSLVKKIEAYAASGATAVLHLDATLNGFERLLAHDCAERLGLQHVSVGDGLERHITITNTH